MSDVLQWTPTREHTSVDRAAKTCISQFYMATGCRLNDLRREIADKDGCWERVKRIGVISTPGWWWWWWWQIVIKTFFSIKNGLKHWSAEKDKGRNELSHLLLLIYIFIGITKSHWQHGFLCLSLPIRSYHSSLKTTPYIPTEFI